MQGIFFVVSVIAGIYGAIVLMAFLCQSRLLYYPNVPSREITATPASIGLPYESVHFVTADGVRINGWLVPAAAARATLIFFHGNAGNISHRLDSLRIFNSLGLSTLIIDYRGYGQSEGRVSEQGTYDDAEAAWQYLTAERGLPAGDIVIFGRSLGAAVAAHLAAQHRPRALILESAFISVPEMAAGLYPFLPVRMLCRFKYNTAEYIKSVSCPLLIVHSPDDETIPFAHGRSLFALAGGVKQFLEIRGSHNEGFMRSGQIYVDGLDDFLAAQGR